MPHGYRLPISLAAVSCAGALAACGSSGPSSAAASGSSGGARSRDAGAFIKFSVCMRAHGVPNFPDPVSGGGIHLDSSSGIDPKSPAFQAASQTCKKLLPGGGPPPVTAAEKRQALAFAQCMRTHGVPNFPDPVFPAGGGRLQEIPVGVTKQSPAFQTAARACGGPGKVRIGASGG